MIDLGAVLIDLDLVINKAIIRRREMVYICLVRPLHAQFDGQILLRRRGKLPHQHARARGVLRHDLAQAFRIEHTGELPRRVFLEPSECADLQERCAARGEHAGSRSRFDKGTAFHTALVLVFVFHRCPFLNCICGSS